MPIYVSLPTPVFLDDGWFVWSEPYKATGRVQIEFNIVSGGGNPWFKYDFGTGLNGELIDCDAFGVIPSPFSATADCAVVPGPSSGATASSVV